MIAVGLIILAITFGCAPSGEPNDSSGNVPAQPKREETSSLPYLSVERWARRSVLDLAGQLPTTNEIAALDGQDAKVLFLINAYANSSTHAEYFSSIFPYIWNFNDKILPDLDRFINQGNATLEAELTSEIRQDIQKDISLQIKNNMDSNLSFQELFSSNFSIGEPGYLGFWNLNPSGYAWLGSDLQYAFYEDSRPNAGLFSNQSFLANFDSRQDTIPYARTYNLLRKMSCIDYTDQNAHKFYDVEELDIVNSLRVSTMNNKVCGSCHAGYHRTSHLFTGLASGETFGEFSLYSNTPSVLSTSYLGKEIDSLQELSKLVGLNPAVHRCQIKRIMEAVFQKAFQSEFDSGTMNIVADSFKDSSFKLSKILPVILESNIYKLGPFNSKTNSRQAKSLSGLRFLNQKQWLGIIKQFGFDPSEFEIDANLNPSYNELTEFRTYFPQGAYWLAAERLVRQFSSAIVNREINLDTEKDDRRIFTELTDTVYGSLPIAQIKSQISGLVLTFTSLTEDDSKDLRKQLYDLWVDVKGIDTSIQAHREAWNTTLIALFLSKEFLTY